MLLRFLQDWFKWAESGGHSTMFRKDHGLCGALSYWCMYVERCSDDKALKGARRLRWLLAAQYPSYREVGAEQNSSCYPPSEGRSATTKKKVLKQCTSTPSA